MMTRHPGNITSTYRFQFHRGFTFSDLEKLRDYLKELGVGAVYASPIFRSAPGSTHGYDVLDPLRVNPELGTEAQLAMLVGKLREDGTGWMQDIVPNHMGFHPGNPWLADVLEKGPRSVYASFFDSSLSGFNSSSASPFFRGRIMAPFLGASLEEVIEKEELKVTYSGRRLVFSYYDQQWPLHPLSYAEILQSRDNEFDEDIFAQLPEQIARIQQVQDAESYTLQWNEFLLQLASLVETAGAGRFLSSCLEAINSDPDRLKLMAGAQVYRLCSWQETNERINFRRFFTINGLICLNMQEKAVFRQYHRLIQALLEEGLFTGLRVDHVDGLFDPPAYLEQLRELAGGETSIVVEKILESGEELPSGWPVQGTSGYEFLALVNNLFTQSSSRDLFSRFYREFTGEERSAHEQVAEKKALILQKHMQGELDNLYALFRELPENQKDASVPESEPGEPQELGDLREPGESPASGKPPELRDPRQMREAIGAFLVHCPVYRFYGNRFPLEEKEAEAVRNVLREAGKHHPSLAPAIHCLEEALLQRPLKGNEEYNQTALLFYQRCMQFTGPLMAKGVEDTLMYTYNRFIGHNEVGDSPDAFGITPQAFHREMQTRLERWPGSLNATSTHDTKRGEDVRARLSVLTALPREWTTAVRQWKQLNGDLKQNGAPDANDEYFIYQTLAGTWPFEEQEEELFRKRLEEYLVKALREAKRHTGWEQPDKAYEEATKAFAAALPDRKRPFRKHFLEFLEKIRDPAKINSLAQVLLKFTCPGVPDIYQGCEAWDLSLVDPDNRRPVDFRQRQQWLHELTASPKAKPDLLRELWKDSATGRIKLWLIRLLLQERKRRPQPFSQGTYIPLEVKGRYRRHILAFARRHGTAWYLTIIPLHLADLCRQQKIEITALDWKDTRVILPGEAPREWENLLDGARTSAEQPGTGAALGGGHTEPGGGHAASGHRYPASGGCLLLKELFSILPLAFLKAEATASDRSAGILMHITSLPSPFGTGDMGPAAREFIGFLGRAGQRYWQVLPLNPVVPEQQYSPYSPVSSMAGNTLLISPELLAEEGWLAPEELRRFHLQPAETIDFSKASQVKEQLLKKAWDKFRRSAGPSREKHFRQFCAEEAGWLEDFALYMLLKKQHDDLPWYRWPEKYRLRDKAALEELTQAHGEELDRHKWLQFIFTRQWKTLREHCAAAGVALLGDLPFYISYDSADVWSQPGIFSLGEKGRITAVAGVPPDYFNSDGQLWGMPVFRWDVLKEQGYSWWVQRIRRNMDWFDLLRLDHFRAFSAYWEVPAGEKTAINGRWKPGPGADLFRTLQKEPGSLPLVAEDLGDIDEPVYRLRDEFGLPGMKVLQFAFGEDMASSPHIPHRYTPRFIAYTGTHDNNTARGWYNKELTSEGRKRLSAYADQPVTSKNVHHVLSRLAYASVAGTVILPLQDVLGLDERARMNVPASMKGNWLWRILPGQLTEREERRLLGWVNLYGRGGGL